jgi:hypothetical protein
MNGNLVAFVVLVLGVLAVLALGGCSSKPTPKPTPKYSVGQVVFVKISNEPVMVLRCYGPQRGQHYYWCRVGGGRQRRRDDLVSADTEVARYTKVEFWEMELMEQPRR